MNNDVLPSWTLILPESWDESKPDFKGEVDGFKIREEEEEGRKNMPARSHCSFGEPEYQMDGHSDWCGFECLIASCQSRGQLFFLRALREEYFSLIHPKF